MSSSINNWRQRAAEELNTELLSLMAEHSALLEKSEALQKEADTLRKEADTKLARAKEIEISASSIGISLSLSDLAIVQPAKQPTPARSGKFKELALEILKRAYPNSMRASDLGAQIEQATGATFHEKTAGMTLYRLAQDGVARRKGWNWFYVPEAERKVVVGREADSEFLS